MTEEKYHTIEMKLFCSLYEISGKRSVKFWFQEEISFNIFRGTDWR